MAGKSTNSDTPVKTYSVKQLAKLFGKSEDTIRRWKNEGIGTGPDAVKLNAVQDGSSARHLVFTEDAVREFILANPNLLDDSPELLKLLDQTEPDPTPEAEPNGILGKVAAAAGAAAAIGIPAVVGVAALGVAGTYLYRLLQSRETELKNELARVQAELDQIAEEKRKLEEAQEAQEAQETQQAPEAVQDEENNQTTEVHKA